MTRPFRIDLAEAAFLLAGTALLFLIIGTAFLSSLPEIPQ